jgi:hypothetical protein
MKEALASSSEKDWMAIEMKIPLQGIPRQGIGRKYAASRARM